MRSSAFILTYLLILLFCVGEARADRRVALVVGNSSYVHAPRLNNPENDAAAIGLLFKEIGFDSVNVKLNLGVDSFRQVVRDFAETSRDADIAVIFFAGHGIEVDGANYLVPVDAAMKRDVDVEDETVSLDRLLKVLEPAKRLRLVILDACRDNPFSANMRRTLASRSIGRGLARVEPAGSDTLIAFAARAGSTAADGDGANSPFTGALIKHLPTAGLDVRLVFGRVRDEVLKATNNAQEPFVYGSLGGSAITLALPPDAASEHTEARSKSEFHKDDQASRDYELAAKIGTASAWSAFIAKYPSGFYSDLARAQRSKLASLNPTDTSKPSEFQPKSATRPVDTGKGQTNSSQLACCLRYYQGERSLEGWGPAERCRRNMAATKMDWCAALRKETMQRRTGEGCSAMISTYRSMLASGQMEYGSDAARYIRRQCHIQ